MVCVVLQRKSIAFVVIASSNSSSNKRSKHNKHSKPSSSTLTDSMLWSKNSA